MEAMEEEQEGNVAGVLSPSQLGAVKSQDIGSDVRLGKKGHARAIAEARQYNRSRMGESTRAAEERVQRIAPESI